VARALGKLPRPPHRQGLRRGRHRPGGDRGSARPLRGQHLWGAAFEDLLATDLPDGRNLAEEYLRRRGWKEPAATRAYIAGLRRSAISLYEVSGLVPGDSMLLRDLVRGGAPIRVMERSGSRGLRQWDRIATRVITRTPPITTSSPRALALDRQVRRG
jgi:hypothetical protein